ncbi:hypothetical protein CRT38_03817 [Anaplasma phagocytophilum str. CRT38]|uniref:Uncharacterized protein n=1 Tax=Anaplasma phagocytophilum str. CRT38 TaxID=1269275 RepID=S6G838_ANAPH|nr:hypothetical protein CRT38_03817 [Anaplasma phagocytophilum str. CRT38]
MVGYVNSYNALYAGNFNLWLAAKLERLLSLHPKVLRINENYFAIAGKGMMYHRSCRFQSSHEN